MDNQVSDTTLRSRRDEWEDAGVFEQIAAEAVAAYDRIMGLELPDVCIDGSTHKAPCGGPGTGESPVDRRKSGWKWSLATDGAGIPIGWAADGANRNDIMLFEPTLDEIARRGLHHDIETVHLDRGYIGARVDRAADAAGITDIVRPPKRRPGPGAAGAALESRARQLVADPTTASSDETPTENRSTDVLRLSSPRKSLADVHPDLFRTLQVPKAQELIAEPARHDGWDAAAEFFEHGLQQAFAAIGDVHDDSFPYTVFYAFKQSETDASGTASTGWETMLEGLLDSGASIVRTWPVRTEQPGGLREVGRAALASSIILVCRRRPDDAPVVSRRDFLTALRNELPEALAELQAENIAPVDLAQSSIGPGMAVFSRYSRVVELDGSTMRVRDALAEINRALDAVLEEQDADLDADTRWALAWYAQHGHSTRPAGDADTLCKAKNTSIAGLVEAGILRQQGNECRLLTVDELDEDWDPATDRRLTVWETTLHLRRKLMSDGEQAASALLAQGGVIDDAPRDLAYRLFHICERQGWQPEAVAYNALVTSWPEIIRQATAPTDLTLI